MTAIGIESIAYALPRTELTNDQLKRENPGWDMDRLALRTGVFRRRIAAAGETALDLAFQACSALAADGRLRADEIDALIFCTETPDYPLPPNSALLHQRLGLGPQLMAFDITLACSGFVYGLGIARSLIQSGTASRVLLATADTYSRLIRPGDRALRTLFGDGGAVTVFGRGAAEGEIIDVTFGTSGAEHERFIVRAGGARQPHDCVKVGEVVHDDGKLRAAGHIDMDGLGVLSFFNTVVPKAIDALLARNGLSKDDIDWFVLHQASQIALEGAIRAIGIGRERFVIDIADVGNLVSASIPVALARSREAGRFQPGQRIVLCGFGVGLSWATALLKL
jgi:3-oxoacyl-[acyl-carrier-protein] synthase-3